MTASGPIAMPVDGSTAARRLADAVTMHYHREVRSIARIAKGMGTANWLVRNIRGAGTPAARAAWESSSAAASPAMSARTRPTTGGRS